jgi:hypothetical protein
MDEDCAHNRATYGLSAGKLLYVCPDCHAHGERGSAEEAYVTYLLELRRRGETLSASQEAAVAYSPFGTGVTQRC